MWWEAGRQLSLGLLLLPLFISEKAPLDPARLHVSADWYIFEPVDRNYRLVLRGEPSHTVLMTNLANRVQPLIRYDQGDSVTLRPDARPCGSPLPAIRVVGRTNDTLSFQTDNAVQVRLLPLALGTVIAWKRLTSGVSSITVPKASGRSFTCPALSVWKERVSLVRPTTRMAGRGLPHGQASGLRVTESPWS